MERSPSRCASSFSMHQIHEKVLSGKKMLNTLTQKRIAAEKLKNLENRIKRLQLEESKTDQSIAKIQKQNLAVKVFKQNKDQDKQMLFRWKAENKRAETQQRRRISEQRRIFQEKLKRAKDMKIMQNRESKLEVMNEKKRGKEWIDQYHTQQMMYRSEARASRSFDQQYRSVGLKTFQEQQSTRASERFGRRLQSEVKATEIIKARKKDTKAAMEQVKSNLEYKRRKFNEELQEYQSIKGPGMRPNGCYTPVL